MFLEDNQIQYIQRYFPDLQDFFIPINDPSLVDPYSPKWEGVLEKLKNPPTVPSHSFMPLLISGHSGWGKSSLAFYLWSVYQQSWLAHQARLAHQNDQNQPKESEPLGYPLWVYSYEQQWQKFCIQGLQNNQIICLGYQDFYGQATLWDYYGTKLTLEQEKKFVLEQLHWIYFRLLNTLSHQMPKGLSPQWWQEYRQRQEWIAQGLNDKQQKKYQKELLEQIKKGTEQLSPLKIEHVKVLENHRQASGNHPSENHRPSSLIFISHLDHSSRFALQALLKWTEAPCSHWMIIASAEKIQGLPQALLSRFSLTNIQAPQKMPIFPFSLAWQQEQIEARSFQERRSPEASTNSGIVQQDCPLPKNPAELSLEQIIQKFLTSIKETGESKIQFLHQLTEGRWIFFHHYFDQDQLAQEYRQDEKAFSWKKKQDWLKQKAPIILPVFFLALQEKLSGSLAIKTDQRYIQLVQQWVQAIQKGYENFFIYHFSWAFTLETLYLQFYQHYLYFYKKVPVKKNQLLPNQPRVSSQQGKSTE